MAIRWSELPEHVRRRVVEAKNPKLEIRNPKRRIGGRVAAASGESFERRIVERARQQRLLVELCALPKSGARFHGQGKAHPEPICCDFVGSVVGTGRAIFFDAKRVAKEKSLRLADAKIVKPHQAEFLRAQAEAGAIAGLLVIDGSGVVRWLDGRHLGPERTRMALADARFLTLGSIDFARLVMAYTTALYCPQTDADVGGRR